MLFHFTWIHIKFLFTYTSQCWFHIYHSVCPSSFILSFILSLWFHIWVLLSSINPLGQPHYHTVLRTALSTLTACFIICLHVLQHYLQITNSCFLVGIYRWFLWGLVVRMSNNFSWWKLFFNSPVHSHKAFFIDIS